MKRDLRLSRLIPELREKLSGRAMVMAMGVAPEEAIADHNAHLREISRRDSLSLDEVTYLRATAGR
jgi:hypothetical protein